MSCSREAARDGQAHCAEAVLSAGLDKQCVGSGIQVGVGGCCEGRACCSSRREPP